MLTLSQIHVSGNSLRTLMFTGIAVAPNLKAGAAAIGPKLFATALTAMPPRANEYNGKTKEIRY